MSSSDDDFIVLDRVLNHLAAVNASIGVQMRHGEEPNPVQIQTMLDLQRELASTLDAVSLQMQRDTRRLEPEEHIAYADAVQTLLAILIGHRLTQLQQRGERKPFTRLIEEVHGTIYGRSL